MVYFIIDLSLIPNYNNSYFWNTGQIPINSTYKITDKAYYKNSRYIFRDINILADFNKLLNNSTVNKPISYKKYNMGNYYIPTEPIGQIIKYETIPEYTRLYNKYLKSYYIAYCYCYTNISFKFRVHIKINCNIYTSNSTSHTIEFIAEDVVKTTKGYIIKYIPTNYTNINISDYYTIDINDIIDYKKSKINSYNNIHLMCKLL